MYIPRHTDKPFVTLIIFAVFMIMIGSCFAQQIKVATGGAKGTYSPMFKELAKECNTVPMIEQNTSGSVENVNLLVGNQVNAAIVQTDVIFLRAQKEDMGQIKTLFTLHPEEVHIVALTSGKKEGGIMGVGAKEVSLNSVSDLAGRIMGAVGGSAVTAQVIRLQGEINYSIQEFNNNDEMLKALAARQVDAILLVGGAPLPLVSELGPEFKLLTFPDTLVNRLKAVYSPAMLNYSKMRASGIQSVSTSAIFVTRDYKTVKYTESLVTLRSCMSKHLDELKETTGTHPKWQQVKADDKGKWTWYEPSNSGSKR